MAALSAQNIVLTSMDDPPPCGRCGGEGLLGAKVPHQAPGRHGTGLRCIRGITLCARCDADDPWAAPLILFFAVHGQITDESEAEFETLLRTWVGHARVPDVDLAALDREIDAWHRGELDADEPSPPGPYEPGDSRLEWSYGAAEDDLP
jgi:hypothetical protein